MGTATLTRSQSRKTRSAYALEASKKGLCSPFEVLPGNNLNSASRRQITRPSSTSEFLEKENAPPSRLKDRNPHPTVEKKGLIDASLQKGIKKRKQPVRESEGLCRDTVATNLVGNSFETPTTIEIDVRSDQNIDMFMNPLESETTAGAKLGNTKKPSTRTTCDCQDDRAQPQSGGLCETDTIMKAVAGLIADKKNEVLSKHKCVDQVAGAPLSSASALALLQKDYEKLFCKYQKLKARRQDEVEALYKEQNSRITDFVQVTEDLIEFYKGENESLRQNFQEANVPALSNRCKLLEKANVECRNNLLQEQSKTLELRQENKRLKSLLLEHIADKENHLGSGSVPVQGSQSCVSKDLNRGENETLANDHLKLVQKLLGSVLGLQLSCTRHGVDSKLHFQHRPTGFSFNLKEVHDADIAEVVGGGELVYENVSVGACKRAVDWMKMKEVVFGMDQVQLLFKKLTGFLNRGSYG